MYIYKMTAFVQEFFLGVGVYCYAYFAVVFMTKYQKLLLEGKCLLPPPGPPSVEESQKYIRSVSYKHLDNLF